MTGSPQHVDVAILGQGLAGTTLAWECWRHGLSVCVIDPGRAGTSSRVAAGLITPFTGKRCLPSWRYAMFWPCAVRFYRSIERITSTRFFHELTHDRVFVSEQERNFWLDRNTGHPVAEYTQTARVELDALSNHTRHWRDCRWGGLALSGGGRLDVPRYLRVSRQWWSARGAYRQADVSDQDLVWEETAVRLPRLGLSAQHVILCRGAEERLHPWFPQVRFLPAQGEILSLAVDVHLDRVVHQGVWLAPVGAGRVLVGSTYAWDRFDGCPTPAGSEELRSRLAEGGPLEYRVLGHFAAVRPALHDQKPVLGWHPHYPRLGLLNGLGSKGSLQAPWLARHFAEHLATGTPLEAELDLQHKYPATQPESQPS